MSHMKTPWMSVTFLLMITSMNMTSDSDARGSSALRKVQVAEYRLREEVTLDIGELTASGAVRPASAISIDQPKEGCWTLRTPKGPRGRRWYRNLLNATPGAPQLRIDPGLKGVYDVYAQVRAVCIAGSDEEAEKQKDTFTMAFEIALDHGSEPQVVGARASLKYHYDTEVLVAHQWRLDGRKIVLRNIGKPVYLYGFRFVPVRSTPDGMDAYYQVGGKGKKFTRWLATDHVTIAREPDKHLAFPGAALLNNGDIIVTFREGTKHGVEPIGKVCLSRSTDGGRTWLPRVTVLDRRGVDDRDSSVFQMSDGTVLMCLPTVMCTSHDFGKTWSEPMPTPVFSPSGAIEDEDGNIVYAGLMMVQGGFAQIGNRRANLMACAVYRSKDKGRSWQQVGIATYTVRMRWPEDFLWQREPSLCIVPSKFYVMCTCNRMRGDGFLRIIRSTDRGRSWGPIIKTPVWGKPGHLLALKDGRLLMTYGYRRPPWGVRACLSSDYGKTWDMENEIIIRMDGGTPTGQPRKVGNSDLGYPVSIRLDDRRIFTVYYFNKDGSNAFIAGTFWELPRRQGPGDAASLVNDVQTPSDTHAGNFLGAKPNLANGRPALAENVSRHTRVDDHGILSLGDRETRRRLGAFRAACPFDETATAGRYEGIEPNPLDGSVTCPQARGLGLGRHLAASGVDHTQSIKLPQRSFAKGNAKGDGPVLNGFDSLRDVNLDANALAWAERLSALARRNECLGRSRALP